VAILRRFIMMELLIIAVALTLGGLAYSFRSKKISIGSTSNYKQQAQVKLKKAVKLKKTNMDEAIVLLKEAYEDGEAISLQEFLRLPNYLRLNKQYDEAYQECCKLTTYGTPIDPQTPDSIGWYIEQSEILKLSGQILVDEGNFGDAIYCNVLRYHYELKAAQKKSQSDRPSVRESGVNQIVFYKTDKEFITRNVLEKILKGLNKENKQDDALAIIMDWNKNWPQDPEALGHDLEKLLYDF